MLRKICNHPDLSSEAGSLWKLKKDKEQGKTEDDSEYGHWKRSGKLIVVHSLLKLWKKQKHKVLLFSQTRQVRYERCRNCKMLRVIYLKRRSHIKGTLPSSQP